MLFVYVRCKKREGGITTLGFVVGEENESWTAALFRWPRRGSDDACWLASWYFVSLAFLWFYDEVSENPRILHFCIFFSSSDFASVMLLMIIL